jgi:hypothetical protein
VRPGIFLRDAATWLADDHGDRLPLARRRLQSENSELLSNAWPAT